jgi:hypothetical protein
MAASLEDVWRMCEGTTTVTSGPERYNSNPVMSRANESDQDRLDSRSLDGMQEVRGRHRSQPPNGWEVVFGL